MDFESFCIHNDIEYSISNNCLGYYPRGFVFKNINGKYHIALNGNHNIDQLRKTMVHEIAHVMQGHLDKEVTFKDLVEEQADRLVNEINISLQTAYNY